MSGHNGFEHCFVINLVSAGFNHNHFFIGRAYDKVQIGLCFLLRSRVKNDFTVNKSDLAARNRSVPRNIGNGNSHRGAEHSADYIWVIRIYGKCGHNYGTVVAHILWEKRTHGAIHYAAVKNGAVGWATFSSREGAGDFADGIELFVKIDGKREIVDTLARGFACGGVAKHSGFAVSYKD